MLRNFKKRMLMRWSSEMLVHYNDLFLKDIKMIPIARNKKERQFYKGRAYKTRGKMMRILMFREILTGKF